MNFASYYAEGEDGVFRRVPASCAMCERQVGDDGKRGLDIEFGALEFCSQKCEDAWIKRRAQEAIDG